MKLPWAGRRTFASKPSPVVTLKSGHKIGSATPGPLIGIYEFQSQKKARVVLAQIISQTHGMVEGHPFRDGTAVLFFHSTQPASYEAVEDALEKFAKWRRA